MPLRLPKHFVLVYAEKLWQMGSPSAASALLLAPQHLLSAQCARILALES